MGKAARIFSLGMLALLAQRPLYAGSIAGEARLSGAAPKFNEIKVTKDQDYCGVKIPNETYVVGPNGTLKNVVVFLDKAPGHPAAAAREHVFNNQSCRFAPRVMAMMVGDKLILKNSDPKLHIVHSYLHQRTVFNASLPFKGHSMEISHKVRKPGLMQVSCDTHAWMRGHIYVFDHPFFAVTDENGAFAIPNVPAGKYMLKAWHEDAGVQTAEVVVPVDGEAKLRFEVGRK